MFVRVLKRQQPRRVSPVRMGGAIRRIGSVVVWPHELAANVYRIPSRREDADVSSKSDEPT